MIHVHFTTGKKSPLSWLIRAITGEDCSHCVIEYNGLVIHSDFRGIIIESKEKFLQRAVIVHTVRNIPVPFNFYDMLDKYGGSLYDIPAFIYMGLRLVLPFLPKANLWHTTGMYLCTEFISSVLYKKETHLTPYKFYLMLRDKYDS